MSVLQLIGIEKQYRGRNQGSSSLFRLKTVDLTIEEGEFFALLGPSGCGKTTLLKLVAGLLSPDKGEIMLDSGTITRLSAEKRGFGMVFQQPLLFPHMSVEDNVAFGLKMQGAGRKERLQKVGEILSSVELEGFGQRYPSELSGGQQQRVSLARAIVIRPKLLLMDEPFSSLDPGLRDEMRQLVKQIHRQYRTTILFVTHDRDEAFLLANRIGVMNNGTVLQVGKPQHVYENPQNAEVALFMGVKNVLKGESREGYFRSGDFIVELYGAELAGNQSGWFILRPESLQPVGKEMTSNEQHIRNLRVIYGTVKDISFRQGFYDLKVQIGSIILEVIEKSGAVSLPEPGEPITLQFDIRQTRFIPDHRMEGGNNDA